MFPIKPLSFLEYIQDYEVAALFQSRGRYPLDSASNHVQYLWNALVVFNHLKHTRYDKMIWACSFDKASPYFPEQLYDVERKLEGQHVDVGGPTHYFIKEGHRIRFIDMCRIKADMDNLCLIPEKLRSLYLPFYTDLRASDFLMSGKIFHYRAGSNWNRMRFPLRWRKKYFLSRLLKLAFNESLK